MISMPLKKQTGVVGLISVIFILVILVVFGLLTYFLFFSETPRIETVLPPILKTSDEIARVPFVDLVQVVNSNEFRSLESYVGMPSIGALGRTNPFIEYREKTDERNRR